MPQPPRLSILVLADDQKGHPNTIHDHIQAFGRYSRHRVELFNPRGLTESRFLKLDAFDVVVIHYSIVIIWDDYLSPQFRERIAMFDGLKVQFLQDEYRFVDDITAEMRNLGIDVLYSVVPEIEQPAIYGDRLPTTEILFTLTGYVPDSLSSRRPPALNSRRVDVGYRGRSVPLWLGRLGYEKVEIGRGFLARAAGTGLECDIAWTEGARIHGEAWNAFMQSCRSMLASESGSSFVDFDGSIERAARGYVALHPTADYDDVEQGVLAQFQGGPSINTASPRLFEAAGFRTAMVMFPGEYSDIVHAWEHYIPLDKDFGNFEEVVGRLRDIPFLEVLTQRAHDDLIASGLYSERRFIEEFDDAMTARAEPRDRLRSYPAKRLALEQLSAGRNYRLSGLYWLARELILVYLGSREALRQPALRRLLVRNRRRTGTADSPSLWGDVFRLAMLTAIHSGSLRPASEPFKVEAAFDVARGHLTFTSRTHDSATSSEFLLSPELVSAVFEGELRAVIWNHAPIGQYVTLNVPPLPKRISFDVGRYDAYGVYRFEALTSLARESPGLVLAALTPLLPPRPERPGAYGSNSSADPMDANEAQR
jgi:hypothetical protein